MTDDPFARDPRQRQPRGGLFIAGALAFAVVGTIVSLFVVVYIIRPRLILRDFHAFLERHPIGTSVDTIASDPFVRSVTTISTSEGEPPDDNRSFLKPPELEAALAKARSGEVDLMWTHSPPFGRVGATFRYESGRITKASTFDLD